MLWKRVHTCTIRSICFSCCLAMSQLDFIFIRHYPIFLFLFQFSLDHKSLCHTISFGIVIIFLHISSFHIFIFSIFVCLTATYIIPAYLSCLFIFLPLFLIILKDFFIIFSYEHVCLYAFVGMYVQTHLCEYACLYYICMHDFAYTCEGQKSISGISLNYSPAYTLRQIPSDSGHCLAHKT